MFDAQPEPIALTLLFFKCVMIATAFKARKNLRCAPLVSVIPVGTTMQWAMIAQLDTVGAKVSALVLALGHLIRCGQ
jgi:hypothetical protein|tara:strand:+ start:80 stop:310 length:231 start_codon:yes stop_codon:yes gene_type:complete